MLTVTFQTRARSTYYDHTETDQHLRVTETPHNKMLVSCPHHNQIYVNPPFPVKSNFGWPPPPPVIKFNVCLPPPYNLKCNSTQLGLHLRGVSTFFCIMRGMVYQIWQYLFECHIFYIGSLIIFTWYLTWFTPAPFNILCKNPISMSHHIAWTLLQTCLFIDNVVCVVLRSWLEYGSICL